MKRENVTIDISMNSLYVMKCCSLGFSKKTCCVNKIISDTFMLFILINKNFCVNQLIKWNIVLIWKQPITNHHPQRKGANGLIQLFVDIRESEILHLSKTSVLLELSVPKPAHS